MQKSISFVFLFVALILGGQVHASIYSAGEIKRLFPVVECPAVSDEYEKMLNKLDDLKASIKKAANCKTTELKVKSLEDLFMQDRQKVLEILNAGREQVLSQQQTDFVRKYAEEVTKKVAAIHDLFVGNGCFSEDHKTQTLNNLASFVNEASRLVGVLAGPWGTPIMLSGQVVAGFMTGLDQVMQSRAGYDFSQRDGWMSYVKHLCTYHTFRDQVEHLLNPQQRIDQLTNLKIQLDAQIATLSSNCKNCLRIQNIFNANRNKPTEVIMKATAKDIAAANKGVSTPRGSFLLQNLGIRDWVIQEMQRLENESKAFWNDVAGRHLLTQAKDSIERFLVGREAPRFLRHQVQQSQKDFSTLNQFLVYEGWQLYRAMNSVSPNIFTHKLSYWSTDGLAMVHALLLTPVPWSQIPAAQLDDMRATWNSYRHGLNNYLRTAGTSLRVVQGFCSFFKHTNQYNSAIRAQCAGAGTVHMMKVEGKLQNDLVTAKLSPPFPPYAAIQPESVSENLSQTPIEALMKSVNHLH